MKYIVTEKHETEFPDPMVLKCNEKVSLGEEYNANGDWPNWIYCTKPDGSNKGYVPKQIIKRENDYGIIMEDYSANELNVKEGDIIEEIKELNGWKWSRNINTNEIGWIPVKKVKLLE
jgi:hypothetical protein